MNCPSCGQAMILGYFGFKSKISSFLLFGASSSDLYFFSKEYDDKLVQKRGEKQEGYFCNNCFTKVILNREPGSESDSKVTL